MKLSFLPLVLVGPLCLSSCGLLQSATQLPIRTLQTVGRAVGIGLEQTEVEDQEKALAEVRFEIKEGE